MKAVARTDPGRVRETNEDCVFVDPGIGLMVVADGMGGQAAGEVASRVAVDAIRSFLRRTLPPPLGGADGEATASLLTRAIAEAAEAIREKAASAPEFTGMGTTAVVAVARDGLLHIAHVGDSRAYLLRGGSVTQLTRDHSLVAEMAESGEITEAQARTHRLRHILSRSLGGDSIPAPDVQVIGWSPGDRILLCTDGLSNMLEDDIIERVLTKPGVDLAQTCDALIGEANARGGKDNISVVLACAE